VKPRPYTGTKDGIATGKRPGTEQFVNEIRKLTGGKLWNNGTWVVRSKAGKQTLSVHATGRAMDLSYRGKRNGRQAAEQIMELLVANNRLLQVECILDYFPAPYGRGWRCDRQAWSTYKRPTITGAPGGDWIHIEISPRMADQPQRVVDAFAKVKQI
jgi:hypothetical protein